MGTRILRHSNNEVFLKGFNVYLDQKYRMASLFNGSSSTSYYLLKRAAKEKDKPLVEYWYQCIEYAGSN